MPWGTNAPTKRVGNTCWAYARAPIAGNIDSRNGSASVVPRPRKNIRRGNLRLVRNTCPVLLRMVRRRWRRRGCGGGSGLGYGWRQRVWRGGGSGLGRRRVGVGGYVHTEVVAER